MMAIKMSQAHYAVTNFKPLAAYILRINAPGKDPLKWGLSDDRQTETVAWAKAVNSVDPNLGWAVRETDLVQRMNKRGDTSKSYHYVISFPAGERPSREVLENIEAVMSAALGYKDHQRLMAVHTDTDHLHMHVAINRVHPQTFKCIGSPFDRLTLNKVSADLEDIYGLTKDNHQPGTGLQDRQLYQPGWQKQGKAPLDPAFIAARQQSRQARKAALDALRVKHQKFLRDLLAWHGQRRHNADRARLSKADRRSTMAHLRDTFTQDHNQRKIREKQEREAIKEHFPILTLELFNAIQATKAHDSGRSEQRVR